MKLITRDTDYAIRSLVYMAKNNTQVVSVQELVEVLQMPRAFLRRLLQLLSKHNVLKSLKGKGGGFILNAAPKKISIIDIIQIFQGQLDISNCFFKKEICPNVKTCPLRKKIKKIEKNVFHELSSTTIASLLRKTR
ncbi:MAG: Rrf2 family transcriptional regulator [Candidatus Omnitrophica bacterium]|nr:Rrf2 family transcriptional regulator [Candidatus Omnitrophota bacterium]